MADPGAQRGARRRRRPSTTDNDEITAVLGAVARPAAGGPGCRTRHDAHPADAPATAHREAPDDRPDRADRRRAGRTAGAARVARACAAGPTRRRPPCSSRSCSSCRCCSSFRMSRVDWPLLGGRPGLQLPGQLHRRRAEPVLRRLACVFTLKYTVIATVLLIAPRRSAWRCWCRSRRRWKGFLRTSFLVPSALGLASASLLFYVLYSPLAGPLAPLHGAASALESSSAPRPPRCASTCSSSCGGSPASTC